MLLRPRMGSYGPEALDSQMALYEILTLQRVLTLYGPVMPGYAGGKMIIDQFTTQTLIDSMLVLGQESNDPIWLVIDTPGGFVDQGMLLYDMMQLVQAPVYTVCRSALSMGAIILAGGEPGHRYMFPHARVMLHQVSTKTSGNVEEAEKQIQETRREADLIVDTLIHCGVKKEPQEIYDDIQVTNWMNAEEAIAYGLADKILPPGVFGPTKNK